MLFSILIFITFLSNNVIAEMLLVKGGDKYLCAVANKKYCITCEGRRIPIEGGIITQTLDKCKRLSKPPNKPPDITQTTKDVKKK